MQLRGHYNPLRILGVSRYGVRQSENVRSDTNYRTELVISLRDQATEIPRSQLGGRSPAVVRLDPQKNIEVVAEDAASRVFLYVPYLVS